MNREREDFNWIKTVWAWDLKKYVYHHWANFYTRPRLAQLAGMAIGMEEKRFLFNYGCGVGKTKQIIDLIRYHRFASKANRWLVLIPNIINVQSWEDQIELHGQDLTYQALIGTRAQRHVMVNERVNIHLLNYAGLQSYMAENVKGEGRVVNKRAVRDFVDLYDGVIMDESHNLGNHDSLTFRLCRRLSKGLEFCYLSTATLFGRDPTMLWPQFYLVDHGYTLGETLGLYRSGFFNEVEEFNRVEYAFDRKQERELSRFIRHRSLRYTAEECGDVPAVNPIRERLSWGEEQLAYYTRTRNELRLAGVGKVKLNPHAYTRMRQITSGYVGYSTEDDGKAKLVFDENPKLERLLQVIDNLAGAGTKLMIFHKFIFTGEIISEALAKRKIKVAKLFGNYGDGGKQWRMFLEGKDCPIIAAQYRRVAGGNPHYVASWMYFFESPEDPITRTQVVERLVRPGQPRKVNIWDPMMPNSVDEDILNALDEDEDFSKRVSEGRALINNMEGTG
jgi:superfamily II DNA or RNA helicase